MTRLIDIGIKPFLVASSTRAMMAQRLVRKLCPKCMRHRTNTPKISSDPSGSTCGRRRAQLPERQGLWKLHCTGHRGRFGIFEIFVVEDEARKLIYDKVPASVLRKAAREMGMKTLVRTEPEK